MQKVSVLSVLFFFITLVHVDAESSIEKISVSQESFNPNLNQSIELTVSVTKPGSLAAEVLDQDGRIVNRLPIANVTTPGKFAVGWKGQNQSGQFVNEGAYTFRIQLQNHGKVETFQSSKNTEEYTVRPEYYDPERAIISYKLPEPSLVLIEVGTYQVDSLTKDSKRIVGKTVTSWEPRVAGPIVQVWNGYDSNGKYLVYESNFYISIRCKPLPENSVIVTGRPSRVSN